MIRPRVGVAGISFVHDVPGKEEKLVECVSLEVCQWLMSQGAIEKLTMDWQFGPSGFRSEDVLTILRQEANKS